MTRCTDSGYNSVTNYLQNSQNVTFVAMPIFIVCSFWQLCQKGLTVCRKIQTNELEKSTKWPLHFVNVWNDRNRKVQTFCTVSCMIVTAVRGNDTRWQCVFTNSLKCVNTSQTLSRCPQNWKFLPLTPKCTLTPVIGLANKTKSAKRYSSLK